MIQYDKQRLPVHLPKRHNRKRRHKNNRPFSQQTTTTTKKKQLNTRQKRGLGQHQAIYMTTRQKYWDMATTPTTCTITKILILTVTEEDKIMVMALRLKWRSKSPQRKRHSDQGGRSHHSSAGNGGSKPGGSENEYSGSTRPEGSQPTVFNSASQNKGGQSNGAVRQQANNEQVQSGQVVDSTQNTQRNTQRNTPPLKLPPNGTSGKHDIQRGNSKGNQQDRVNVPSRNAEIRRGRPRQPTTPEPQDYKYSPLTKICSCMNICPYNTFNMGPCRGVVSLVSRQRRRTCCMRPESVMRILLPLALLQNLLAEL
ncbi:hypothetical protein CHS0354_008582 [Potamilus streckersoni]|uniref:Uncharacterized protein n=1 Tax=Potamilus streckersoni TaxID=2493646 RepID=A0AAE0TAF0_9BIVA|nr:hypothetical protein CHS0354_008582 [Potamilus streckersoni]